MTGCGRARLGCRARGARRRTWMEGGLGGGILRGSQMEATMIGLEGWAGRRVDGAR